MNGLIILLFGLLLISAIILTADGINISNLKHDIEILKNRIKELENK